MRFTEKPSKHTCAIIWPALCNHLARDPRQPWYSHAPTSDDPWPDAWCSICHQAYMREGEWNDDNEKGLDVHLFCHHCYESHREQGTLVEVPRQQLLD